VLLSPTASRPPNYFNYFIPSLVTQPCLCRQCPSWTFQRFWCAGTLWPSVWLFKMWQQGRITYTVLCSEFKVFHGHVRKVATVIGQHLSFEGSSVLLFGGASFVATYVSMKNGSGNST